MFLYWKDRWHSVSEETGVLQAANNLSHLVCSIVASSLAEMPDAISPVHVTVTKSIDSTLRKCRTPVIA